MTRKKAGPPKPVDQECGECGGAGRLTYSVSASRVVDEECPACSGVGLVEEAPKT